MKTLDFYKNKNGIEVLKAINKQGKIIFFFSYYVGSGDSFTYSTDSFTDQQAKKFDLDDLFDLGVLEED